jgi:hypothetical protein
LRGVEGRAGQAAQVEKEKWGDRLVSGKRAHGQFLFIKTFSICKPFSKFKIVLYSNQI